MIRELPSIWKPWSIRRIYALWPLVFGFFGQLGTVHPLESQTPLSTWAQLRMEELRASDAPGRTGTRGKVGENPGHVLPERGRGQVGGSSQGLTFCHPKQHPFGFEGRSHLRGIPGSPAGGAGKARPLATRTSSNICREAREFWTVWWPRIRITWRFGTSGWQATSSCPSSSDVTTLWPPIFRHWP